jgi:isopenicillin N synthase-like dioxygenase
MSVSVVDFNSSGAQDAFCHSLLETGFAVLKNHRVQKATIDGLYSQWLDFFNSDEKYDFEFDEQSHSGYIPLERSETAKGNTVKDLKEFYHYFAGSRCPSALKAITEQVFADLSELAQCLLGWVEHALPDDIRQQLSLPLSDMIVDSTHTLLRVIHYPPIGGEIEPGAIRAAAHEDINLLTMLPAASAKGLQVQLKSGQWSDVPCEPGWMIVNIGDMLSECTQGYYRATSHRVINPEGENARVSRVSSPLFLHPREEVVLSSRHTAGSYREERFRELGLLKK